MFEIRRLLKLIGSVAGGAFASVWAALAPLAAAFKADLAAGEQALIAGAAALVAAVAAWAGGLVKQLFERAKGELAPEVDEVVAALESIEAEAREARKGLVG